MKWEEDKRDTCKLCIRKSPNYCKRHSPKVRVEQIRVYKQEEVDSLLSQQKQKIVGTLKQLNLRSQKDAYHCNCLPHAIWVIEGKDEEAKEILKELEQEQEIVDIIINGIERRE